MSEDHTATPTAEELLLNSVKSDPEAQTLELLKGSHRFSQNVRSKALISACKRRHKFLVQALVHLGANVNTQDTQGNTPLMICAENGFTDIAQFLINKQAVINAVNSVGDTALMLSVRPAGSMEMMKLLLEQKGVSINHQNREGYTALMKAIEALDIDLIILLVKAVFDINTSESWLSYSEYQSDEYNLVSNNKGETTQIIAERCGLKNVLIVLKIYMSSGKSPLILAADMDDVFLFSLLLNSKMCKDNYIVCSIYETMTHLFRQCQLKDVKTFTDSGVLMIKKLLENGADLTRSLYDTPDYLLIAAESGNFALVKILCEHGAPVQQMNSCYSDSPLSCALIHGHIDCANILLEYGAQIDVKIALDLALEHEKPKYLSFLTENYKQEVIYCLSTTRSNSLLVSAARKGNIDIIGQLLDLDIDVNEPDDCGVTPLGESKNKEVAQLLIQRGAGVNSLTMIDNKKVPTILHILSQSMYVTSKEEIFQVLLDNGADIDGRDELGMTPLMIAAAEGGNECMLQMLLDHGAELTARDNQGNTVLLHAARTNNSATFYLLQLTGDKYSFLNVQNKQGETALIHAVKNKNVVVTQELLNMGADVNIKDKDGNTALLHAVCDDIDDTDSSFYNYEKAVKNKDDDVNDKHQIILKMLIKAGSDVNCQNNKRLSPLMVAAKNCKKETMKVLLDSGAHVNAVRCEDNTETALSLIFSSAYSKSNSKYCVNFLLNHGASSSYISLNVLFILIKHGQIDIIPKLIQSGLGPEQEKPDDSFLKGNVCSSTPLTTPTPFTIALLYRHVSLARYFVENLYLTTLDVSLMRNQDLRLILRLRNHPECISFLSEISSQPMSLFNLTFVSVSSCLGTGPGRENRVDMLPLPQKIKDKLLFKTEEMNVRIPKTARVTWEDESLWKYEYTSCFCYTS